VVSLVTGLCALERAGVEHPLKQECAAFLKTSRITPSDYLDFDPFLPGALAMPS